MNCNIKYINQKVQQEGTKDANNVLKYDGKSELELLQLHADLVKYLLKFKGDFTNYYLYENNGQLMVYPSKFQQFKDFISFDNNLKDVVVFKNVSENVNGIPIYAVGINVFGNTEDIEQLDSTSEEIMSMLQIQAMYFNAPSLLEFSSSMQTYINEFDENFQTWVENAKGNLENYKNSLDSFNKKIFTLSKKDIGMISKELSSKEGVDKLKGLMDYILKANQLINKFNTEYLGENKSKNLLERSRELTRKKETYKTQPSQQLLSDIKEEEKELHILIDQARHVYHAFSLLEQLHADFLKANIKENIQDIYDIQRLNTNLTNIYNEFEDILEKPDLNSFIEAIMKIDKTDFLNPFDFVLQLSSTDVNRKNDLTVKLNEAFVNSKQKFSGGFNSLNQVLSNALNQSQILKYNLNEVLTEVTLDTLLPIQEKYVERTESKDYNDEAVKNYKIERDDFRKLLKIAKADTGFFSHFLSATVDLKDPLTKTVVTHIKDELSRLRLQSLDDRNFIQKACKDLNWVKKTQQERDDINRKLTTYGYVVKTNYKKQLQYKPATLQTTAFMVDDENQATQINFVEGTKPVYYKNVRFFNQILTVQVQPDRNLIKEYDSFKFDLDKKVFFDTLPRTVDNIMNQLDLKSLIKVVNYKTDDAGSDMQAFIQTLDEVKQEYGIDLTKLFFKLEDGALSTHPNISKLLNLKRLQYKEIKENIKNKLIADFFKDKLKNRDETETKNILKKHNLLQNTNEFVNFNTDDSVLKKQKEVLSSISRKTDKSIDWFLNNNLDDLLGFDYEQTANEGTLVLSKNILIEYLDENDEPKIDTFKIINTYKEKTTKSGNTFLILESTTLINNRTQELVEDYDNFTEDKITNLYLKKGELKTVTDLYSVEGNGFSAQERNNWKDIHNDSQVKEFYSVLRTTLDDAHNTFGGSKAQGLPKMWLTDEKSKFHKLKMFILDAEGRKQLITDWFDKAKDGDSIPLKDLDGNFIDIEGNIVDEPIYISKEKFGTDGYSVRYSSNNFNKYIPVELRETDLPTMILAYKMGANFNGFQQENIPLLNSVRTLTQGDKTIGIESRKTAATDAFNNVLRNKASGKVELVEAKNLQNSLISFLDDVLYGYTTKEKIIALGNIRLNMNKLASNIQMVGAFQTLAFNLTTVLPNHGVSFINNLSESAMGRYFDRKQFLEAYRETWKYATTELLGDFKSMYLADKSWYIQAATMFNAVSGEFFDEKGLVQTESLAEKVFNNALFFNMNAVEVTNQLLTMVSLMKGFKVKDENGNEVSLYDSKVEGWKRGESLKFKDYVTVEQIVEFSSLVQKVNRQLHGNYQSIDKNMLQRLWYGKLIMTYKRWIYDTIRSRFAPEDISYESSTVEEGYFRTYFKILIGDYKQLWDEHKFKGFTDKAVALQYGKALGKLYIKSTLGFIDAATFKSLSKTIPNFNEWMYGNVKSQRAKQALTRATLEMGLFLQFTLLGVILHALAENYFDEDEDPVKWKMLKFLEYNAFRMQADMGLYIPHFYAFGLVGSPLPVGFAIDQVMRIQRDYMTLNRLIDNNFAVISDLFDFFEDGNFDWAVNDVYEKSGKGYEKGDSKFFRKIAKTALAPAYQVIRFMNIEDQLDYMNLMFKNAK